jgi:hypothetical protein
MSRNQHVKNSVGTSTVSFDITTPCIQYPNELLLEKIVKGKSTRGGNFSTTICRFLGIN